VPCHILSLHGSARRSDMPSRTVTTAVPEQRATQRRSAARGARQPLRFTALPQRSCDSAKTRPGSAPPRRACHLP
jgi:hypothetical protein